LTSFPPSFLPSILPSRYFLGVVLATIFNVSSLKPSLRRLYPLVFSLGVFLTLAYYGLDHFNPESIKIREQWSTEYPHVYLAAHLEHCLALPVVLVYARNFNLVPSRHDVPLWVGGYASSYLGFTFVTKQLTGEWVYPIFNDVENNAGPVALTIFLAVMVSIIMAFGYLGCWLTSPTEERKDSKQE
jgi:hypothetical protein